MEDQSRELPVPPAHVGRALERIVGAVAFVVPFALALPHLETGPRAATDLPLLRGLAWVGNGFSGAVSALVVQAAFALPLGSPAYRAALVSAALLGLASAAVYALARTVLAANATTVRLSPALALIAALTVSLSAAAQREAEIAGSATVALLLALAVLMVLQGGAPSGARRASLTGLLLGALMAERWACAVVLSAALYGAWRTAGASPRPRALACAAFGSGAALLLFWSPMALRPFAPEPFMGLRSVAQLLHDDVVASWSGVRALHSEVGWLALALALAGCAIGLVRVRLRLAASALLIVVALDALSAWLPIPAASDLAALHLLALAALAVSVAVAVQTGSVVLARFRLPFTRGAIVFLVMADLTLTASMAEQSAYARAADVHDRADELTDDAFVRLPENAALLLRTPSLVWRFLVARLVENNRSDVLLVVAPLAAEPRFAATLLATEPVTQQLLRDIALEGSPREEALTMMADTRPTLCELDRGWDRRVLSHLVPEGLWLRFAAQPLGVSDRRAGYRELRARVDPATFGGAGGGPFDEHTVAVLRARLVDVAVVGAAPGDRDELPALLQGIDRLAPADPFVRELSARLAIPRGAIDWRSLPR